MNDYNLYHNDCLEHLKTMEDNSIDSIVTDPPYGLGKEPNIIEVMKSWINTGYHKIQGAGFMGKEWDSFVPQPIIWKEVFRVLKPGGHILCFSSTRTFDWMSMSLRFAGFEIRDMIAWVYGSGFPKSLNIGKAVDEIQENEREVVGKNKSGSIRNSMSGNFTGGEYNLTKGNTEYEGWGTALKPALEPIIYLLENHYQKIQ
jgi:site-specific DNA-methyltransferase (adenine-specific)